MKNKLLLWESLADVQKVTDILRDGGVVLGSTDTVPGLMTSVSLGGCETLNRVKQREKKPYLLLVNSFDQAIEWVALPIQNEIKKLLDTFWPGPLTVLFSPNPQLPAYLKRDADAIAIRVPNHKGLRAVAQACHGLFSTSANLTGMPVPATVGEVKKQIIDKVDAIIDHGSINTVPSTIIDTRTDPIRLIREGIISRAQLEKIYGRILD